MASKGYLRHDFRVYRKGMFLQFRAAAMLRGSFILQILGMIINNVFVIAAWLFLFHRFGEINGWTTRELIALQGINMLMFGLCSLLCWGIAELPRHVDQGSFDNFLTKPVSILVNLASSKLDVSAIGDLLLGIGLTVWYMIATDGTLTNTLLFFVTLTIACVIFCSLAVLIPNVLAFYFFDSDRLVRNIIMTLLDTSIYPTGVLSGPIRTVLLTVVPGLFMGAISVDVLRGVRPELTILGIIVASAWLALARWLFKRGLARYESANLVGSR